MADWYNSGGFIGFIIIIVLVVLGIIIFLAVMKKNNTNTNNSNTNNNEIELDEMHFASDSDFDDSSNEDDSDRDSNDNDNYNHDKDDLHHESNYQIPTAPLKPIIRPLPPLINFEAQPIVAIQSSTNSIPSNIYDMPLASIEDIEDVYSPSSDKASTQVSEYNSHNSYLNDINNMSNQVTPNSFPDTSSSKTDILASNSSSEQTRKPTPRKVHDIENSYSNIEYSIEESMTNPVDFSSDFSNSTITPDNKKNKPKYHITK